MHVSMHIQLHSSEKGATAEGSKYHYGSSSTVGTRDECEENSRRKAFLAAARKLYNESTHLVVDKSDTFPQFMRHQILTGKILGKGTYCDVCEIRGFQHLDDTAQTPSRVKSEPFTVASSASMAREEKTNVTTFRNNCNRIRSWNLIGRLSLIHSLSVRNARAADDEVLKESRDFIASHCFRNGGDARYAIKCLSKITKDDPERLQQGILDMAMEARILSNFTEHPNVIKMRAVSDADPFEVTGGFFIVLDRLYDTLEQRLKKWKSRRNKLTGIVARFSGRDPDGLERKQLHTDRLVAAYDLSSAVAYMHLNRIIHRDLKPANIGFDIRGDIKVFDFGLAKIVPRTGADAEGRYAFTAMCGTMRYMAPEVGLGQPYNESCDTYSFSVLLWEIMTLDRPFGSISPESLQSQVWGRCSKRPALGGSPIGKKRFSSPLQILMNRGWSREPNERPKMVHVENILRKECIMVRNGDESGLDHSQRRSTHIFNPSSSTRTL